jgi:hypothetical protein
VTDRQLVALGWISAVLAVLVGLGAVVLLPIPSRPGASGANVSAIQAVADAGFVLISPLMGLLIVRAQPRNVIGWLFIAFSGLLVSGFLGDGLARHLAPSAWLAWLVTVTASLSNAGFIAFVLLVLTFPTGRPLSRRWHWVLILVGFGGLGMFIAGLLRPLPITDLTDLPNPIGPRAWSGAVEAIDTISSLATMAAVAAAIAHIIVRIRRSRGVERQQLKWFVLSTALVGGLLVLAAATLPLGSISDVFWAAAFTAFPVVPVAAAIAIVRHRLFDIDLIIKRSVSYAALSLVLIGAYVAGILLLQLVLEPFTKQGELAVAGSTLAVAALFQPARRRIQRAVDRRFDRARYDATGIMASFSSRLRDGLDLESVGDEIVATVAETMRPASVKVWLRRAGTDQ